MTTDINELQTKLKEIIFDYCPENITLEKAYEILEQLTVCIVDGKGILDFVDSKPELLSDEEFTEKLNAMSQEKFIKHIELHRIYDKKAQEELEDHMKFLSEEDE